MKIVLLEDVKALGRKGEVVKVNDGYARNYIIPKKLGVEADAASLNRLKQQKKKEERIAAEELATAQGLADALNDKLIKIKAKVGEGGRLFGAVSSKDIAEAIDSQLGIQTDKKKIVLDEPIKNLGVTQVKIHLHKDVTAQLNVVVTD